MFGSIGGGELLFLLLLALVLLGPRRLPEIGRVLGKAAGEFRKAASEFRRGVEKEIDLTPVRDATRQIARARQELTDLARAPVRALTEEVEAERAAVAARVTAGEPESISALPPRPQPAAEPSPTGPAVEPSPKGDAPPGR